MKYVRLLKLAAEYEELATAIPARLYCCAADGSDTEGEGKVIVQISNMPGYQGEYRMHIDSMEHVPFMLSDAIEKILGREDWMVDNRGTRTEIQNITGRGMEVVRDDEAVIAAIQKAVSEVLGENFEVEFRDHTLRR